jgi:hypothetical protein
MVQLTWDQILDVSVNDVESIPQNVRSELEEQLAPLRTADISDESDDYTEEEEVDLCHSVAIVLNKLSQHCAKANLPSGKEPANDAVIHHVLRRHSTEKNASKQPDIVANYGTVDDSTEYLEYLCHTTTTRATPRRPNTLPFPTASLLSRSETRISMSPIERKSIISRALNATVHSLTSSMD